MRELFRMPEDMWDWLQPEWFSISTLRSFDWANPWVLYLLPLIPLLYWLRRVIRGRRHKLDIALFEDSAPTNWTSKLRHVPNVVFAMFMVLVLIALARPQRINEQVEQHTEGIDIMLVLDISGSMKLQDFSPDRLEAAKDVALEFIDGRIQDRIGAVVFAGEAFSLAPLTTDYELLRESIRSVDFTMIQNDGTAIGSALAVGINRMRESETKSRVMILLSDGENTAGHLDPILAAELAHAFNIKIYTIGIGRDGRVPMPDETYGGTIMVNTRLDETTLRQIASIGKGQFFRATSKDALKTIFKDINRLEKAEIKENRFRDTKDYYQIYLKWALLLLLTWLLLKSSFMANALED